MSNINLKDIENVCVKFNNDIELIKKELKRLQSIKCRLKKQKGKKTYTEEMTSVLKQEQVLKEAKSLIEPSKKHVTEYTVDDVKLLDYDETIKAIRSIQSKKTLTKWLNDRENDNDEYRKACEIEKLLLEHKKTVQPVDSENLRKSEVQTIIDTIENTDKLSKDKILELLNGLIK